MELEYSIEWFQFADSDLAAAEYLQGMHPQPMEIICYHCQQSAEKYLKGYLIFKDTVAPPRIHNIDTLCEMCSEHDGRFHEIKKACNVLTGYGVQSRYPNEMEITENDMQNALAYARQIQEFEPLRELRRSEKTSQLTG
ncbi:MAG: HEPN domain-containing protein [Firmicutes bacterium]|nr:HEPN domain-containing protein [Bacillota bacterium]